MFSLTLLIVLFTALKTVLVLLPLCNVILLQLCKEPLQDKITPFQLCISLLFKQLKVILKSS